MTGGKNNNKKNNTDKNPVINKVEKFIIMENNKSRKKSNFNTNKT